MPEKKDNSTSDNHYESTFEDKRRAQILGVFYVILAILLAWMLFKIWPPTPWPTDKAMIEDPQLVKNLKDCECRTPTPTPTPGPKAAVSTTTNFQTSPTVAPTSVVAPTPPASGTQTASQGAGAATSPSPSPSPSATATPRETLINIPINFFWGYWCYSTSFDERLILLVIVAGMLGSFVHAATSLADFTGNNNFNKNWTWFYLLRPVIGMSLALVFYFVIRGGFLTTSGGAKDINPYGIAALAGLVGMFSKQATDKLSEVFSTLFKAAPGEGDDKRSGSLKPDAKAITITAVQPKSLPSKSTNQTITVTGTNFVDGSQVLLDETAQQTTFVSASKITARLADQALAAPKNFKLKVVNPDGTESPKVDFIVT